MPKLGGFAGSAHWPVRGGAKRHAQHVCYTPPTRLCCNKGLVCYGARMWETSGSLVDGRLRNTCSLIWPDLTQSVRVGPGTKRSGCGTCSRPSVMDDYYKLDPRMLPTLFSFFSSPGIQLVQQSSESFRFSTGAGPHSPFFLSIFFSFASPRLVSTFLYNPTGLAVNIPF